MCGFLSVFYDGFIALKVYDESLDEKCTKYFYFFTTFKISFKIKIEFYAFLQYKVAMLQIHYEKEMLSTFTYETHTQPLATSTT